MSIAGQGAVTPGTDLSVHARELRRVHDAVLSGSRSAGEPRAVVARSWRRVLAVGLDADGRNARDPLPLTETLQRREGSPIALVIDELRHVLTSVADASTFLMVVTDADGVVLWREGSSRVRRQADTLGFAEGALWTEETVGTNAIGTALAEAAPVELFSAEHFEQAQHPWYCSAWPMHDPRTGELLGVVDVSGPALTLHPAIRVLVESAVRLAETRLVDLHRGRLERLRRTAEPLLGGAGGPLLVVDDLGWVAHSSGVARRDRIQAPQPDLPMAVPGLGRCVPERLGEGWLLRPGRTVDRVTARLDVAGRSLEVRSGDGTWRTDLSGRHVELLRLVAAAGRGGVSAVQLSAALFGDVEHVVTVRAELSRLRRKVGALVDPHPYRVADGVELTVLDQRPA
ncbi:GAF domain-containing protein [Nocardioides mangrovi]|uniref:GAF domain-containing protein n=1 Tax=Nocardioides mangrovi TaxID=2874580 RepID=A0ABS7U9P8_9ACTN|nr:GAF domain-containing protein [Nocardioides mangrovi]MBZ5737552.1 GAF domain-containing protein [Nocardioides mangrovi]